MIETIMKCSQCGSTKFTTLIASSDRLEEFQENHKITQIQKFDDRRVLVEYLVLDK